MFEVGQSKIVDPLTQALSQLVLGGHIHVGLDAGGDWSLEFPANLGFALVVVQKGESWLSIAGRDFYLRTGDCFLLTGSEGYVLSKKRPAFNITDASTLFPHKQNGVIVHNGGGDFFSVGTAFEFKGHFAKILLGRLPPIIHVPADSDQAAVLRWTIERFGAEFRGNNLGKPMMLKNLVPIMLLQTIRIYLSSTKDEDNWFVALADPRLSQALVAIHADCKQSWSLESLAERAGMSRSSFANTFKKKIGMAPIDYLTHWRMQVACELLVIGGGSMLSVADAVGYGSESAFSAAFLKIIKCRPGQYQRENTPRLNHG